MSARADRAPEPSFDLERRIAGVLIGATYLSVGLIGLGVVLMIAGGISPLDRALGLDPARLADDILAGRPEGVLWLGLVAVIGTPTVRVTASLVGYLHDGERPMVLVALGILGVIAASVLLATGLGG
ncbi:MAG: DUF1634 domain-containing protein [Chloroflexota bacterium]